MKSFKKYILSILLFLFVCCLFFAEEVKIARDKTMLKEGPGNFYDNLLILKVGTRVQNLGISSQDTGWITVKFENQKGYISKLALKNISNDDMFAALDNNFSIDMGNQIAPASYTAAIKGFALDYSRKHGKRAINIDDLLELTEFRSKDYNKVRREAKLAFFPVEGELIGVKDAFINDRMSAIGLTISLSVLEQGVVFDKAMTRKVNVIANILNRHTYDYDVIYHVWIIKDSEPVAFSGPGGYIFISNTMMELLSDYREIVAIIGHEIGHIALRHGVQDLAYEQAKYSAEQAFDELDSMLDENTLRLSAELEDVVAEARNACVLVRDDKQEFEADDVSVELLRRYKIDSSYLKDTLRKVYLQLGSKYPRFKDQLVRRMNRIK
ncbi:MAG: M48 family metalloprotease [Spirochaetes bacterium]|nr:M48 family metalloprotease [Spirochaetota bacterium]